MEAALVLDPPAVGVRDRLAGFVAGVSGGFVLARQRENALLYVQWLAESMWAGRVGTDVVSVGGDAGSVRVDAAVPGRFAGDP